MPDKDDFDLLLDSALANYADPGPDCGLEQRVLSALAGERTAGEGRKTLRWLAWAIAVPVAVSMLLWIGTSWTKHAPSIETQQARTPEYARRPGIMVPGVTQRTEGKKASHPSGAKARAAFADFSARLKSCPFKTSSNENCGPLPKLDVFPTPQPMTAQERALAVVAMQSPAPVHEVLVEAQRQDDAPIRIAAIHIPPIELPTQTQP